MMGFIPAALHNELAHFGLVADALLAYGASTWLEWAIESAGVHPSLAWGVYLSTLGLSAVAAFKHANLLAASIQSVAEYAAALTRANIKNNVAQKMASPLVWLKKKALAWVRQTGLAKYGGDAAKVVVGGESAGGHIAALVALTQNDPAYQPGFEKADTSVIACVDIYGVVKEVIK